MTKPLLQEADFKRAAAALDTPVAGVKAVCAVEAPNGGFLATGEPTILFERHVFHRLTNGKYSAFYPDISNPVRGGYGKTSEQHGRLQRATVLNRDAALKSASWGKFQIMGENYRQAGFSTIQAFINAMYESEGRQLDAFVSFVKNETRTANGIGLLQALRTQNWAAFARIYNGSAYRENKYDTKLAAAFKDHSTGSIA